MYKLALITRNVSQICGIQVTVEGSGFATSCGLEEQLGSNKKSGAASYIIILYKSFVGVESMLNNSM